MTASAKRAAQTAVNELNGTLRKVSHAIHARPEIGFEEEFACGLLCDTLDAAGFAVTRNAYDLETGFVATKGSGPVKIGICAEYDALPGIGHACGHNIIAASSIGAALAASRVADEMGLSITVFGTPAEEVGNASGKVLMVERGAFSGLHVAMMVHPAPFDLLEMHIIAASMVEVCYRGKEAHASAFPERGVNAADALLIAQTAIGLLRQHILPTDRVHGITTKGGDAPNIIPAETRARYIFRAENLEQLKALKPKVMRCFDAGAVATGARLEIHGADKPYAEMRFDSKLGQLYLRNAVEVGRKFDLANPMASAAASTDMGNVSHVVPSIHPMIGIDSWPAVNHQPEFTAHCVTAAADRAVIDGATAMAWTAIDVAADRKSAHH